MIACSFVLVACGGGDPAETTSETGSTGEETATPSGEAESEGAGESEGGEALRPSWHEDVAPLVYRSCVGCHYDGGIGPFALDTYERAAPWGPVLDEVVQAKTMPPWGAHDTDECQSPAPFKDDMRLSDAERQLFADWVAAGTPEGDPAKAAALPEPPSLGLKDTTATLQNPVPFTVEGKEDLFVCMVVDPGNTEDVWVTGTQMVPDNDAVVHHVLTYIDPDGASDAVVDEDGKFDCPGGFVSLPGVQQMSTWVPGGVPTEMPPDTGIPMPAGSKVIMAYHYHPSGAGAELDQSSIAMRWTTEKPPLTGYVGVIGAAFSVGEDLLPGPNDPNGVPVFEIPPNVADHTETVVYELPEGLPPIAIFSEGAHMHYVGVEMKIWIERDGEDICLLHVPRYDFNWQRLYDYDVPVDQMPTIQGGDKLYLRCTYDNTLNNPNLVEALAQQGLSEPVTVGLGEQSLEEMCLSLFGLTSALPLDELL